MEISEKIEKEIRECSDKLDYCALLIRENNFEPVAENIKNIGNAVGELVEILLHCKNFNKEAREPWQNRCSFCKKKENEVNTLIQGPGVFICNDCVEICNQTLSK